MNGAEVFANEVEVLRFHDQIAILNQVGQPQHDIPSPFSRILIKQDFFGNSIWIRVGDQGLSDLRIQIERSLSVVNGIQTDADSVGMLVLKIGMTQHAHGGHQVVHPIKVTFLVRSEIPHAGIHLLDGFGDVPFVGVLGFGGVQTCTAETGQIFVVRAGPAPDRGSCGERIVHGLKGIHHPRGHWRFLDVVPKVSQAVFSKVNVVDEGGIVDHDFRFNIEVVVVHKLIVEIEWHSKAIRDGSFWEPKSSHGCQVGALGAECAGHVKADVVEWKNVGKTQIALWDLRFCGAQSLVPFIDFVQCGFTDRV